MGIPVPEINELKTISERWQLGLGEEQLATFRTLIEGALGSYDRVDALYDSARPESPERSSYRPDEADNELGGC